MTPLRAIVRLCCGVVAFIAITLLTCVAAPIALVLWVVRGASSAVTEDV